MTEKCLISIIISVCNNEKTLANCLDSLIIQNLKEFEIIVVNNGSTDESANICDSYREKGVRVTIIHMERSDLTVVYNKGLKMSSGRYVHFADAADSIEMGSIQKISGLLQQNLDVIFLDPNRYNTANFLDVSHSGVLRQLSRSMPDTIWDKLIRRELLVNSDILFSNGVIWENVDFSIKLYLHGKLYSAIDFPYYNRSEAATYLDEETMFNKIIFTLSKWTGPAQSVYTKYSRVIHTWMASMYCDLLIPLYNKLPSESRKIYKSSMGDFRWLLDVNKSRKNRIIKMLYPKFGILTTSYIISTYYHVVRANFLKKFTKKLPSNYKNIVN